MGSVMRSWFIKSNRFSYEEILSRRGGIRPHLMGNWVRLYGMVRRRQVVRLADRDRCVCWNVAMVSPSPRSHSSRRVALRSLDSRCVWSHFWSYR